MKNMKNPYTIGLDIGTNSVGWAVLTNQYDLVKRKMKVAGNSDKKQIKKNFWGVRLFDDGQTAVDRRMNRTARRRIERRRNRISYLQEIFAVEMANIDANFFCRLNDSFYVDSEKEIVAILFCNYRGRSSVPQKLSDNIPLA